MIILFVNDRCLQLLRKKTANKGYGVQAWRTRLFVGIFWTKLKNLNLEIF